jgi:glycosyltransferase involved in cell wall biosynthesis
MEESALVSIIIPTYNNRSVVTEAIGSSLNQTYENLEVIVVDDGSTDGTEQLLKEKYKGRIHFVRQENKGPGAARNVGIRSASGKYLQFLDADDLLGPEKIEIQVGLLRRVSGKALSYCDYALFHPEELPFTPKYTSPLLQHGKPFDDIMLRWGTELSIPQHCFMFDAALFQECGVAFDESLPTNEDWECWMNVFALEPEVVFVDRVLAYYRVRGDSRCRDEVKMRQGWLSAIDKQIKKNRFDRDVVRKLETRKKEIRYHYRDVGPLMRMMQSHPLIKKMHDGIVPWRVQRLFD